MCGLKSMSVLLYKEKCSCCSDELLDLLFIFIMTCTFYYHVVPLVHGYSSFFDVTSHIQLFTILEASLQELVAGENLVRVACCGENAMLDILNGLKAFLLLSFC